MFYIHIFSPQFGHQHHKVSQQVIGTKTETRRPVLTQSSFLGSRVDGASKLLIDSALFLDLRRQGRGGVFHVPAARCLSGPVSLSAKTRRPPVLICSSRSPSRLGIIKIIPQPSGREPLCYSAGSVLGLCQVFTNYSLRYNGLFRGSQPLTGVERVICESLFSPPAVGPVPEECK